MKYKFVAFHTMMRGAGKPEYVVNCAKALADAGVNVLVLDAVMYEQGAIAHQFFEILGATPVIENGKNLYDLIHDYEALCLDNGAPPSEAEPFPLANHLIDYIFADFDGFNDGYQWHYISLVTHGNGLTIQNG